MGTSRAITLAPGMRTDAITAGWRADVSTILAAIRAQPALLLTGMIGFALRGGILFLTVPILVLPTSVEVRLLLGDNLNSTGLTPGFFALIGGLTIVTLGIALLALYVVARCELAAFSRYVNADSSMDLHSWRAPSRLPADARRALTSRLFVVEALALLAILAAAVPLASAIGQSTLQEILLPSSSDSIYARIIGDVSAPLAAFLVAILVVEGLSAIVSRRVMSGAFQLKAHFRILLHPARAVAVWLFGWMLFIGAVAASVVALGATWDVVRQVFLSTGFSGGPAELVSDVLVALLFGAVFAAMLLVCGLVSTVRAGLWTLASLR